MALTMQLFILVLLPAAFLLAPAARAGEIIGGREARPHSRPYMAYLTIRRGEKNFRCGGFLVSENFVLTAAHCNGDEITVHLGAHDITKREPSQQVIPACAKIPHPIYDEETLNNDIMLLQLAEVATLNRYVETIPLPCEDDRAHPGTVCSTAGWGMTEFLSSPARLQEVEVEVLEDDACRKNPNTIYRHYNTSTMLCAGETRKGKDSAKGDSGGPLVCGGTALGIVSWGPSTPPGVYTKVSTYISWIREEMNKLQP